MKISRKKILSFVLSISMLLACSPIALAADTGASAISQDQYVDYANNILLDFAELPDVSLPTSGLSLSQPMKVENSVDDAGYVFFLFDQDTCIGELVVSHDGNDFCSSFLHQDMPAVSTAYKDSEPIYLATISEALLICTEASTEIITGNVFEADQDKAIEQLQFSDTNTLPKREKLTLTPVDMTSKSTYDRAPSSPHSLPVPLVKNESVDGVGICWAASTASMIQYRTNGGVRLTAKNVYDTVANNSGYKPGSNDSVRFALSYYGLTEYRDMTTGMDFASVEQQIDAKYPIYMAISGTGNSINKNYYHAVVLCGYGIENNGTGFYEIMDPNVHDSTIWFTVNVRTGVFTYASPYSITFRNWYRTVYYPL